MLAPAGPLCAVDDVTIVLSDAAAWVHREPERQLDMLSGLGSLIAFARCMLGTED